ncbi:hypothetical protein F3J22_12355 [Chitinophaga sp. Cy-1792]|nr:hypothetical protein [Chitinophaga sp. Cy-1792]
MEVAKRLFHSIKRSGIPVSSF